MLVQIFAKWESKLEEAVICLLNSLQFILLGG